METIDEQDLSSKKQELVERIKNRIGGNIPDMLSFENLQALDHSLRKLDESGPASLDKKEGESLFMTQQTADLAVNSGIIPPENPSPFFITFSASTNDNALQPLRISTPQTVFEMGAAAKEAEDDRFHREQLEKQKMDAASAAAWAEFEKTGNKEKEKKDAAEEWRSTQLEQDMKKKAADDLRMVGEELRFHREQEAAIYEQIAQRDKAHRKNTFGHE